MRPSTLREYALQAGFGGVEVLPIQTEYWRFYRLLRRRRPESPGSQPQRGCSAVS